MTKIRFAQSEDSGKITTLLNEGFGKIEIKSSVIR